jgi:hypothetical protein
LKARSATGDDIADPTEGQLDRYGDPDLLAALRRLSDGQRAAVVLYYYADLSIREIADRLGSNSLAVRANLSRGRRRLRGLRRLIEDGVSTGAQWTTDGRIRFLRFAIDPFDETAQPNYWLMNGDGSGLEQLTSFPAATWSRSVHLESPVVSWLSLS